MNTTLAITNQKNIKIDHNGIVFQDHLSKEEFVASLKQLKQLKDAYHNIFSDLVTYGTHRFGNEFVAETVDQLEFDLIDTNKAIGISNTSHTFRTKHGLTSEHYFLLGHMLKNESEQEYWAEQVTEHKLSSLELKRSIESGKVIKKNEIEQKSGHGAGIITLQGAAFSFERWQKQMDGKLDELPKEQLEKILETLSPVVELAATLSDKLED